MKKYSKKLAVIALTGVMATTVLTGCSSKVDGKQGVATLGDVSYNVGTASVFLRLQQANFYSSLKNYMGNAVWNQVAGEDGKTYGDVTKDSAIASLEDAALTKQHAADYSVTISEKDQEKIAEAAKVFIKENEAATLEKAGITEEDVKTYLELNTYYIRVRKAIEETADMQVSDEEAKQSSLSMVAISTTGTMNQDGTTTELTDEEKQGKKELANNVLSTLKEAQGDDAFKEKLTSLDETLSLQKVSFGEEGTELDQAVFAAIKDLKEGTVADQVVEGEGGYYVVRFDKEFDQDATESKKESIRNERKTQAFNDKIEEWKSAKEFKVDRKVWDEVKVMNKDAFTVKVEKEATKETENVSQTTEQK